MTPLANPQLSSLFAVDVAHSRPIDFTTGWWNVKGKDPRLNDADIYIQEAIRMLESAQIGHQLDHTDVTIVGAALEGLDIIQRCIGGPPRYDHSRIALRLRQVADAIKSCRQPSVVTAHTDIETAAELFQAVTEHIDVT